MQRPNRSNGTVSVDDRFKNGHALNRMGPADVRVRRLHAVDLDGFENAAANAIDG
jgi:hypothetical protein